MIPQTNLCFFNTTRFWGGGEKWHFEAAGFMASRGHNVRFIAHPKGELYKKLKNQQGIRIIPVAVSNLSFLNPYKIVRLVRLFRNEKIQTVVFNGSSDVKVGAIAAALAGVPAIVYRRGLAVPVKNSFFNRFLYGSLITHFLTNSEATKRKLFQYLDVPNWSKKTMTIYNGVDLTRLKPSPQRAVSQSGGTRVVIGTAGRLEPEKGHQQLLEVAMRLKQQGLDFQLQIAGDGRLRQHLKHQIDSSALTETIRLLGFVSDMEIFFRKIDIFAFPSLWEGFGFATAEAMAAGCPVVAFNTSSNREVIDNGTTGFLVPKGDIDGFTEKIVLLVKNPELRSKMGQNGRSRVCAIFNREKQLGKLETFLCQTVLDR